MESKLKLKKLLEERAKIYASCYMNGLLPNLVKDCRDLLRNKTARMYTCNTRAICSAHRHRNSNVFMHVLLIPDVQLLVI